MPQQKQDSAANRSTDRRNYEWHQPRRANQPKKWRAHAVQIGLKFGYAIR